MLVSTQPRPCRGRYESDCRAAIWNSVTFFLIGWTILCWPWISGRVTIPWDAKAHFYAQLQFLANAFSSGQSPFWNPDAFSGQPHISDPQSLIFSPAALLAYIFPTPSFQIIDIYAFGLLAIGGIATLMIFHAQRWNMLGGLVAAFAFAFGSSSAHRIQHLGQIQSLAFLMVALWCQVSLLNRRTYWKAIYLGIAVALMVVEPDQIALLGGYMLALHVIIHILSQPAALSNLKVLVPYLFVSAAVCLLIASIPLVLTYLFVSDTTRAVIPFEDAIPGSLHPASLLTSVVSDLFGANDPDVPYWGPFSDIWGDTSRSLTQNMGQLYIGALPVVAIFGHSMGLGKLWERPIRPFFVCGIIMLVFALGKNTPLFRAFYDYLPGVSGFRRPADATFLIGAYLSILGGYLFNEIIRNISTFKDGVILLRNVYLVIVPVILISFLISHSTGMLSVATSKIFQGILWVAAALATIFIAGVISHRSATIALMFVAGFMSFDLWTNNGPNESTALPTSDYEVLRRTSENQTLCEVKRLLTTVESPHRRDRVEIVGVGFHWPNLGLVHGFENILGYNPLRLRQYSRATGAQDQVAAWDQRHFTPLFPSYKSILANLLGMRYVISGVPIGNIDPQLREGDLRLVRRTKEAWIYENPNALPRAMFVSNWMKADFEALVRDGVWPSFNPRKTILLENGPELPVATSSHLDARVDIVSYKNTRIEIDVTNSEAGFIVLNDVWHSWWSAKVNEAPVEILKANVLFRAVYLKPGTNKIVFEFEPFDGALRDVISRIQQKFRGTVTYAAR